MNRQEVAKVKSPDDKFRDLLKNVSQAMKREYSHTSMCFSRGIKSSITNIENHISRHNVSNSDFVVIASDMRTPLHLFKACCDELVLVFKDRTAWCVYVRTSYGVWPVQMSEAGLCAFLATRELVNDSISEYVENKLSQMKNIEIIECFGFCPHVAD